MQQPHSIIQRRLLEANLSRSKINNNHGIKLHLINACHTHHTGREEEDNDLIQVVGKVRSNRI